MLQIVVSLTDDSRGVIYDHYMFMEQATGLISFDDVLNLTSDCCTVVNLT
jgi:hypothetical protein